MPLPDDPGVPTAQALEAYFEYALNGIIEATAEGRVVRGNPAAASILGRSRRRLDGASLEALLAHDDETRNRLQRHRETIAEQGVSLATLQVAIDGAPRTIELASIDVGDGRHLHILDDITEQRQLTASLEAARRAAEEANAAKSAFLANMSHEIRTPLNGIIGIERLLRLTPLTAQQTEYLDDLRRAARVLLALLGDVLDLSKIEAGRFELEPRAFDADEFLETVATACAPAAADKPVRVVFDIDPGVPWHWHGDPLRLAQAVNNLLANAIKFTPSGHVVLAISWMPGSEGRGRLRLAVRDTGIGMSAEQLERVFSPFVQADPSVTRRFGGTGLGLAIARGIVERMGGELTATSRPEAGSEFVIDLPMDAAATGLPPRDPGPAPRAIVVSRDPLQATALARLLVAQAHAVELRAPSADPTDLPATDAETLLVVDDDSEGGLLEALRRAPRAGPVILLQARAPATGAFEGEPGVALLRPPATPLRLRRAIAQCRRRASPGAFDANADEGLRGEFSGASALLVEDHAINRRVAAHLLDYAGIDVAVATNGEEACAALLGPQARPVDIILMDVQMPGMDGLTATQKLRAAGIATPIVALTAGVSTEEREACFAAGMSDWLAKPIDTDDLAAVLTRWLPARRGAAAPSPSPQPSAATAAEARAVPGIDLEGALRRFLGRRDVFEQALGSFVRDQRPEVERIAVLLGQGQSATVARLLHGLAGGAATLGANALQDAARALENAVRSGATDALPEAQRRLREAFDEVESLVAGGVGKPFS